jgi:Spy/CpxP family protein refolding chaperone
LSTSGMTPRRVWLLGTLVLVLTFLAGGMAGAAWDRFHRHGDDSRGGRGGPRHFVEMLKHRYHLTDQQAQRIDVIVARRRPRVDSLMATVQPQLRAAFDSTNAEIRVVLTPEQRAKFDQDQERRRRTLSGRDSSAARTATPPPAPADSTARR